MQKMKSEGGNDYCFADPRGDCQVHSGGAAIPWADSTERLQEGHYIKISGGSNIYCIWKDKDGKNIFGAPDCQYANKEQLAETPGSWNVVVSPAGEISLWEPTVSKLCPDAPKPACAANATMGKWSYRHTISGPTTQTWTHGTQRTHEESKTDTWAWSVTESVSAGFVHMCPGMGMGYGIGIQVTGETAHEISQAFRDEWSTHEEQEFKITWTEENVGMASWQFVFTHIDTCEQEENTATQEFALTSNAKDEPCCLPGFAVDAPSYKVCLSEAVMIPNWQEHGCSLGALPEGSAPFLSGGAHYHPFDLFFLFGLFAHVLI